MVCEVFRNSVREKGVGVCLIENWIDETERRSWFLTEIGRAR
jgi:hypothetical protein